MSLGDQTTLRVLLYEGAGSQPLESETRFALISGLLEKGFSVSRIETVSEEPTQSRGPRVVLGQFENIPPAELSDRASEGTLEMRNLSGLTTQRVLDEVESVRIAAGAVQQSDWKPWFPVIDYDRCTNCMQCLSFCLFGVYGVDTERRIQAQNHDNCKTNCPACSRVCPEAAIMFPKYKAGPINGDLVRDTDLQREKMKVDISSLLGGDVYSLLRQRSEKAQSRFSKERDSDKALKERQSCLVKLAQAGDIPPEVLMSLPSPEEIARRAEEAAARVQAARAE